MDYYTNNIKWLHLNWNEGISSCIDLLDLLVESKSELNVTAIAIGDGIRYYTYGWSVLSYYDYPSTIA